MNELATPLVASDAVSAPFHPLLLFLLASITFLTQTHERRNFKKVIRLILYAPPSRTLIPVPG